MYHLYIVADKVAQQTTAAIYYCAIDKLHMLRIERWGSKTQKSSDGDWP